MAAPTDFSHLHAIEMRLSNERERLAIARARKPSEVAFRTAVVVSIEREIANERQLIGLPPAGDQIDEDALFSELFS